MQTLDAPRGTIDGAFRSRVAAISAAVFVAVVVVHLVLRIAGAAPEVLRASQALLMPALALWAFAPLLPPGSRRRWLPPRIAIPLGLALAFSWVGDVIPGFVNGDTGFVAMVAAFFIAQLAWIVTLWPWRKRSIIRRRAWPLIFGYAFLAVGVLALSAQGAGPLLGALVPYAAVLALTGVISTGLGLVGTLGGLLFIASDAMIAIFEFAPLLDPGEPLHGLAVMSTYCAAQGVLVLAVRSAIVAMWRA